MTVCASSFIRNLEVGTWMGKRMGQAEAPDYGQRTVIAVVCGILAMIFMLLSWMTRSEKKQKKATGHARLHAQKLRFPPGPRGWPVFGSLFSLTGCRHQALQKLSFEYGPLMFMHLGSVPTFVVSNAAMAKEILKTHDRVTASRPTLAVESHLFYDSQDIAFADYGDHWRKARRISSLRLFTASRISHYQGMRREEVQAMVKNILAMSQAGKVVQMEHTFEALTMNMITQMLWNKSHRGANHSDEFAHLSRELSDIMGKNIGDFIPCLSWVSMQVGGLGKRAETLHKTWDGFIERIVNEHRQQRAASFSEGKEMPSDAADFVDVLLDLSIQADDDVDKLSDDAVKAILTDMIIAGTDTMAITLQWALAYLIQNPHVQRKAQDELLAMVGKDRMVTEEEAVNLPYLNAILKETLRLHPPAPIALPHKSTADFTVKGFFVPAGSLIFVNLWAIQRDPSMWERPNEFDPDRFLGSGALDWKGQSFEMIPFGSGRRICPGMALATKAIHLILAQTLHAFDWSLPGDERAEDMNMSERTGFTCRRAAPLTAMAKPRLSNDVYSQ